MDIGEVLVSVWSSVAGGRAWLVAAEVAGVMSDGGGGGETLKSPCIAVLSV